MVPFDVKIDGRKVGISWESLFWFFVVTAAATVVGELVYDKWVSPYLSDLPSLPAASDGDTAPSSPPAPAAAQIGWYSRGR